MCIWLFSTDSRVIRTGTPIQAYTECSSFSVHLNEVNPGQSQSPDRGYTGSQTELRLSSLPPFCSLGLSPLHSAKSQTEKKPKTIKQGV